MRVREAGVTCRLKPGVGCVMVNGSVAVWVSPAEVAVKVAVAVCAWSVDDALKEIFCELPGFTTKLDGPALRLHSAIRSA